MIHETNSIRLRAGKRLFLLLKSEDTYYRIDCNLLSREQETRLFLQFPCSEQELKAMNVSFSVLKAKRIRRILAEGCCRGNCMELRIGLNRSRYSLVNDVKPDIFEAYFSSIPIDFSLHTAPPELPGSTIRKVTFLLTGLSIVFCVLSMFLISNALFLASMFAFLAAITLALVFPHSFTLGSKTDIRQGELGLAFLYAGLAIAGNVIRTPYAYHRAFFGFFFLSLLINAVLWFWLLRRDMGVRADAMSAICLCVLCLFFVMAGLVRINILADHR